MGWRHALQFWPLDKVKQCKIEPWKYACNARLSYGNRNGKQETGMQNNANCCAGQLWLLCSTTLTIVQDNSDCCAGQLWLLCRTILTVLQESCAGQLWLLCRTTLTVAEKGIQDSSTGVQDNSDFCAGQPWLLCRTTLTVAEKEIQDSSTGVQTTLTDVETGIQNNSD